MLLSTLVDKKHTMTESALDKGWSSDKSPPWSEPLVSLSHLQKPVVLHPEKHMARNFIDKEPIETVK